MDSVVSRCPYLSVQRSNPLYEASGTMFCQEVHFAHSDNVANLWREASNSSQTRGSLGRVNESEASYVRLDKRNWRKRLTRHNQNGTQVGSCGTATHDDTQNSCRVTDTTHPQTLESSPNQQGKPHVSHNSGIRIVRNGDDTGGKGSRSKRKPCCNGMDRAVRIYPTRKGADFRLVSLGNENLKRQNPRRS